jgi:hypothetical protein
VTRHPALAPRRGPRPTTTSVAPHAQLDQQPADDAIRQQLAGRVFALPGVHDAAGVASVPGARALILWDPRAGARGADGTRRGVPGRSGVRHLHPAPDQSLHLTLPPGLAHAAVQAGWAEFHPDPTPSRRTAARVPPPARKGPSP